MGKYNITASIIRYSIGYMVGSDTLTRNSLANNFAQYFTSFYENRHIVRAIRSALRAFSWLSLVDRLEKEKKERHKLKGFVRPAKFNDAEQRT